MEPAQADDAESARRMINALVAEKASPDPLPALSTARLVGATVAGLTAHGQLVPALAAARSVAEPDVLYRWGLAVHGTAQSGSS
jgi:hypothetical protein